jgi:16S rRNA (guanine527-N7)-methyltransferase
MSAKLMALCDRVAAELGSTMTPSARARIGTWLERLQEWNARIDLTAARSDQELVDLMLADALVLAARIPAGASVVDVGTGAGAPGLALALLRDDLRVTLVEPVGKRVSFLRTVLGAVGRADVVVERGRGEVLAGSRSWDIATSRATLAPATWLELGTTLVAPGGCVWVLLASGAPPERAHTTIEAERVYAWPLTRAERRAVSYRVQE